MIAFGTYGTSLHPADVQLLSNLIDYGMTPEEAVLAPRLGWFVFDPLTRALDLSKNQLDERVPIEVVCGVAARGLALSQSEVPGYPPGIMDLGFPTVITIDGQAGPERLKGMTPELVSGAAEGF